MKTGKSKQGVSFWTSKWTTVPTLLFHIYNEDGGETAPFSFSNSWSYLLLSYVLALLLL